MAGKPKTTAEVATTGKARDLGISDKDRREHQLTANMLNPPPPRADLKLPDQHN